MRVKNTNWKKLGVALFIATAFFTFLSLQTKAAEQSDAIAVRVMPNPNHDSIESWYAKQGFVGSPQSLIVDGYEAVRDGRTVFVNAANLENKLLYTNIYLISYNQDPGVKTGDILGQLVSHWKFNNNVVTPGACSISKQNCQADTDCPTDYLCSNSTYLNTYSHSDHFGTAYLSSFNNLGKCILKPEKNKTCLIDSDCPVNLFCDSLKAKTIRDVKRLGDLNKIKEAIDNFKSNNGNYPSLSSGTYVPGSTISLWPSWAGSFLSQIGIGQSFVDPINVLGYCGDTGYDPLTCWNKEKNTFVNKDLSLPSGSYSFIYKATQNGINYELCSVFETRMAPYSYNTAEGQLSSNSCAVVGGGYSGTNSNNAPYVVSSYTNGEAGKEFNGYLKVKDTEGDNISWNLKPLIGWTNPITLKDTGDANQKKLYSSLAPSSNDYSSVLTLTDSRGAISTTSLTFHISGATKPKIEASDVDYFVDPITPLKYTFYVQGTNLAPQFTIKPLNPSVAATKIYNATKITTATENIGLNRVKVDVSFLIGTTPVGIITKDITIPFIITAKEGSVISTKDVNFNLKMEQPYLDFQCEGVARLGAGYQLNGAACALGKLKNGNHSLWYKLDSGPKGLIIDSSQYAQDGNVYLTADKIATDTPASNTVKISLANEYGATTSKSFDLKANTFCGDGIKQNHNSEGRGGLYNDGIEQCDGSQGIITNSISTSSAVQYGCTTGFDVKSPYPIVDNNSCVFKPADNGGGYCGDGYCQFTVGGQDIENCWNCQQDCGTCLATVSSKADYVQSTFYNGQFLYKTVTPASDTKTLTLVSGKNVFGFWAHFLNDTPSRGLSFKVTMGAKGKIFKEFNTYDKAPLLSCTTAGITNNSTYSPNYDPSTITGPYAKWNSLAYESAWASPKLVSTENKFQGLPYIWYTDASNANDQMYCRLAFNYQPYSFDAICLPNCDGKQCGTDGCGGYCGENRTTNGTCNSKAKINSDFQTNVFESSSTNIYKCYDQICKCIPDCNNKICGGDGCGGYCGMNSGSCPGEYRHSWEWNGSAWGNINVLKPQQCNANGQCDCKPDCTNKNCGDDGCGGTCGSNQGACASTNEYCDIAGQCNLKCGNRKCGPDFTGGSSCGTCSSGVCIDGQCTSGLTNIKVSADNGHTTYFNGKEVSGKTAYTVPSNTTKEATGHDWTKNEEFNITNINVGENVFAIWATNDAEGNKTGNNCPNNLYGFSATLNLFVGNNSTPSIKMTTDDIAGWKCSNNQAAGYEWKSNADFYANNANSDWISAKNMNNTGPSAGNALAYKQIWWNGTFNNCPEISVFCRYTFDTNNVQLPCTASCTGKCGGSDGCHGFCPNTCTGAAVCGGNGTLNTCGQSTCTTSCYGRCSGFDGCGGTCPNNCSTSQDCIGNKCVAKCVSDNSCSGKCGGVDNCGKSCANTCSPGSVCSSSSDYTQCF